MLEKLQACVTGLEGKMAAGFSNLEGRLALLEQQPVDTQTLVSSTFYLE